jgi:hypothetical protein
LDNHEEVSLNPVAQKKRWWDNHEEVSLFLVTQNKDGNHEKVSLNPVAQKNADGITTRRSH